MGNLTNCKVCNAEIAKSAKTCPKCGGKNKKPIYKRWWMWVIVISMISVIINIASQNTFTGNVPSKLTLEKYNQIQNGMPYEEVVKIIGFEVSPEVETGERGSELYTVSFRYMGDEQVKGGLGANASFLFQGGKLNMKAQMGLK